MYLPTKPSEYTIVYKHLGIRRVRQTTQIGAGPDEFIPFGQHDPRARIIEPQPRLDLGRNLDGKAGMIGRAVGYRQHQDAGIAVFVGADRGDDGAGAILLTFITSFKMLAYQR